MAARQRAAKRRLSPSARAGAVALEAGRPGEAVVYLSQAVADAPRRGDYRHALAAAHAANDEPAEAIERASEALGLDPRQRDAARLLSSLLQQYDVTDFSRFDAAGLTAALAMQDVDADALARTAFAWIRAQPDFGKLQAAAANENWDAPARMLIEGDGIGLAREPLLLAALAAAPNRDPEIEALFVAARRALLLGAAATPEDEAATALACALVRQCLANEYVWPVRDDEARALEALEIDPDVIRAGRAGACRPLLLGALYRPPESWLPDEPDPALVRRVQPKPLRTLIEERLADAREEAALASEIASLGEPSDAVSQRVGRQYEENPYPRWRSMLLPAPGAMRRAIGHPNDAAPPIQQAGVIDVLVAGCGTGQQAVLCAAGYGPDAKVTALDLSRASLAHAARMAHRYKLDTIEFVHGDLLAIADSGRAFDVIEAVGVLHHMEDPFGGWRVLVDRLKPGGVMYVGLYSRTAREPVRQARERLARAGTSDDAASIRAARAEILASPKDEAEASLARSADFYTHSNVRDLLFHVHEHPLDLVEIEAFLKEKDLEFLGFDLRPHIEAAFRGRDRMADIRDLARWRAFEADNPSTFDGMYLFWVRKPE